MDVNKDLPITQIINDIEDETTANSPSNDLNNIDSLNGSTTEQITDNDNVTTRENVIQQKHKVTNRISTDSTFEIIDYNSSDEDGWGNVNSNVTSKNKPVLVNSSEFPSAESQQQVDELSNCDDSLFSRKKLDLSRSSTKEEKQRQNEEIVIMESVSVSSETESWESVSPLKTINKAKELTKELELAVDDGDEDDDNESVSSKPCTSKGACFIDASSLFDENEIVYATSYPEKSLTTNCMDRNELELQSFNDDHNASNLSKKSETNKTESSTKYDIKDQFTAALHEDEMYGQQSHREMNYDVKNGAALVKHSNNERKQGDLIFKNSIQQYSGHLITPQIPYSDDNYNDMSLPSGFSSCSDYNNSLDQYNSLSSSNASELTPNTRLHSDTESIFLPDTPHNSIVQIINRSNASQERETSSPIRIPSQRYTLDEAAIVSGGATIQDHTPKRYDSPTVRRKTDTCPILSGGSVDIDVDHRDKEKNKLVDKASKLASSFTSWIVDLSDIQKNSSTTSAKDVEYKKQLSSDSSKNSLGFFVNLDSIKTPEESEPKSIPAVGKGAKSRQVENMKKSTGFYVDFSDNDSSRQNTPRRSATPPIANSASDSSSSNDKSSTASNEKKNIFSMFIDIGGEKSKNNLKKELFSLPTRLSNTLNARKNSIDVEVEEDKSINAKSDDKQIDNFNATNSNNTKQNVSNETDNLNYGGIVFDSELQPSSLPPQLNVVRRTQLPSLCKNSSNKTESKRHSWNPSSNYESVVDRKSKTMSGNKHYQRSTSVSSDKDNIMNILDKIPILSKTSSMSIDSSISPYEDFSCSKSELSTYSNNSITSNSVHSSSDGGGGGSAVRDDLKLSLTELNLDAMNVSGTTKKRRRDVKINETFDKSSHGSITDGILSQETTPTSTTDTDDITFQNNLNNDNNENTTDTASNDKVSVGVKESTTSIIKSLSNNKIMETIVEIVESSPKRQPPQQTKNTSNNNDYKYTMESLQATIEKQKQLLLESVSEVSPPLPTQSGLSFVKLSDMDKPAPKFELHSNSEIMSNSDSSSTRVARLFSQEPKLNNYSNNFYSHERHSWNMSKSTGNNNNIVNLASSVENSRSLSRLFPHLSKAFSSSVPTDMGMNLNNKSGNDINEFVLSDFSATSSVTSSRSGGIDSADESSISLRQPRRLGEDLLKMFLQEIATDVIIEVGTRKLKAHKCILRSRCQYFAAILAGGWVQSAGNIISLPGYSYGAVHFALCHIYSGASHPPPGISLMELAALSDLLGLESLREVTSYALKTNYCHNFHKPCSGCIDGILQVLPVTLNHGLDELYRKCLKWVCKYYVKVWPTRSFSQLNIDVINRCRQQIIAHMNSESVLSTILDCEQLLSILAPCRWADVVENIVRDILDAGYEYIGEHFASLIASDSFLSLGHGQSWTISRLENMLLRTAASLTPDQACKSYPRANRLNKLLSAKIITMSTTPLSNDNLNVTEKNVERFRPHDSEEEMDWNDEFIRLVSAILSAVEQCLIRQCARAMRVNSWQRMDAELKLKIQKLACLTDPIDDNRQKMRQKYSYNNTSTSSASSQQSRNNDLRQVRLAIQAHTKRTNNYDDQQYTNHKTQTQQTQTQTQHIDICHQLNKIEKNTQFNIETKNNFVDKSKILKSTSKISVPDIKVAKPSNTIRYLNQSSNIVKQNAENLDVKTTKSDIIANKSRLSLQEVRPRYLEPRKSRSSTVINSMNHQTNIANNKNKLMHSKSKKNMSSSDSSTRTSSPFGRNKKEGIISKYKNESNISLDSLTSPAKSNKILKSRNSINDMEASVDSLGESFKSSIKSGKTISQESLTHILEQKKENLLKEKLNNKLNDTINKNMKNRVNTSSGGLSSIVTNTTSGIPKNIKQSKLPTTIMNKNRSLSTTPSVARKSFLSQKSREILAKKQESKSISNGSISNKSTSSSPNFTDKVVSSASSSSSHRKVFTTTLHLRKTAKLPDSQKPSNKSDVKNKNIKTDLKSSKQINKNITHKAMESNNMKLISNSNDQSSENEYIQNSDKLTESKLERSNTFCMETSANNIELLQMLE